MPDTADLSARLEKLETRIAFQDQNIEDLNTAITSQWAEFEKLHREISRLSEQLADAHASAQSDGQPPPHY
jgi:SlyX protein